MNLEEFINRLDQYGENLYVGDSNSWWEQAIEKVKSDLWDMNITTKARNIDAGVDGDDVFIEIENYLLYQNYGVKAWNKSSTAYNLDQDAVDMEWGITPSGGANFQFGVGKETTNGWGATYSGLNAKRDFSVNGRDYDIQQEFINYFNEIVNQQSEL